MKYRMTISTATVDLEVKWNLEILLIVHSWQFACRIPCGFLHGRGEFHCSLGFSITHIFECQ